MFSLLQLTSKASFSLTSAHFKHSRKDAPAAAGEGSQFAASFRLQRSRIPLPAMCWFTAAVLVTVFLFLSGWRQILFSI